MYEIIRLLCTYITLGSVPDRTVRHRAHDIGPVMMGRGFVYFVYRMRIIQYAGQGHPQSATKI